MNSSLDQRRETEWRGWNSSNETTGESRFLQVHGKGAWCRPHEHGRDHFRRHPGCTRFDDKTEEPKSWERPGVRPQPCTKWASAQPDQEGRKTKHGWQLTKCPIPIGRRLCPQWRKGLSVGEGKGKPQSHFHIEKQTNGGGLNWKKQKPLGGKRPGVSAAIGCNPRRLRRR